MSNELSELEAKLAATFEADQWTVEQAVPAEIENGSAEESAKTENDSAEESAGREVHMNVTPSCFCGNRPRAT